MCGFLLTVSQVGGWCHWIPFGRACLNLGLFSSGLTTRKWFPVLRDHLQTFWFIFKYLQICNIQLVVLNNVHNETDRNTILCTWNKNSLYAYTVFLKILTSLCTSQGLVIADKSHPVIIMALSGNRNKCQNEEGNKGSIFINLFTVNFQVLKYLDMCLKAYKKKSFRFPLIPDWLGV